MISRTNARRLALASLIAIAAGCGGGGSSSAMPPPASGTTAINGVTFAADSDVLTQSPFGESFGLRAFTGFTNGKTWDIRWNITYTGTTVGNVKTVAKRLEFIDAQGEPITGNGILDIIKAMANGHGEGSAYARADDGWIYLVGTDDKLLETPIKMYPSQVSVGTEWIDRGTSRIKDEEGNVISVVPWTETHRIISTDAIAPRSRIPGCVILRDALVQEGRADFLMWYYFKPGTGYIEQTSIDPSLDQSSANGINLMPFSG